MRCTCCNRLLNDFEATRKSKVTGEYLDMCNKCYGTVQQDLATDIRSDLPEDEVPDDELDFDELDSQIDWYNDEE